MELLQYARLPYHSLGILARTMHEAGCTAELAGRQEGLPHAKPGAPGGADLFSGKLYRSLNVARHASPNADAGYVLLAV